MVNASKILVQEKTMTTNQFGIVALTRDEINRMLDVWVVSPPYSFAVNVGGNDLLILAIANNSLTDETVKHVVNSSVKLKILSSV